MTGSARVHEGQPVLTAGAALGQSPIVVILMHGRGSTPANILSLAAQFDLPSITYLAPSAANHTWYPHSFLTEIAQNEPDLSSALRVLRSLAADLETRGIRREHVVLAGFSQGACLSLEFAVRHPARWGGVLAFSGGLIGPPGTTWEERDAFAGTPVFLGCSDVDTHIPKARVDESALVLARMGATVTKRLYPGMGHFVNDDEIASARGMLDRLVGATARLP